VAASRRPGPAAIGDEACFLACAIDALRHPLTSAADAGGVLPSNIIPPLARIDSLLALLVPLGKHSRVPPCRRSAAAPPTSPTARPPSACILTRDIRRDLSTLGFDRNGFVWAGSASSLARFDGYTWTPWPFAEARSLVRDMQTDSSGILWAIFEREGLARYDGVAWSLYPYRNTFHQRFSDTTRVDGTKDYWLGLTAATCTCLPVAGSRQRTDRAGPGWQHRADRQPVR
jgi:hypothetical protein